MSEVLLKTQIPELIEAVHSIMQSIYLYKEKINPKLSRTYLNEIGFSKLPECASFDSSEIEIKREITKLVIILLENILKEVQEKNKL